MRSPTQAVAVWLRNTVVFPGLPSWADVGPPELTVPGKSKVDHQEDGSSGRYTGGNSPEKYIRIERGEERGGKG